MDDVFAVRADQEVALRLDADEILILVEQILHREVIARLRYSDQVLVDPLAGTPLHPTTGWVIAIIFCCLVGKTSRMRRPQPVGRGTSD